MANSTPKVEKEMKDEKVDVLDLSLKQSDSEDARSPSAAINDDSCEDNSIVDVENDSTIEPIKRDAQLQLRIRNFFNERTAHAQPYPAPPLVEPVACIPPIPPQFPFMNSGNSFFTEAQYPVYNCTNSYIPSVPPQLPQQFPFIAHNKRTISSHTPSPPQEDNRNEYHHQSFPKKANIENNERTASPSESCERSLENSSTEPNNQNNGKKDSAYLERRRKNNIAAKRSRDRRRQKEEEIARVLAEQEQIKMSLQAENHGLRELIKMSLEHYKSKGIFLDLPMLPGMNGEIGNIL